MRYEKFEQKYGQGLLQEAAAELIDSSLQSAVQEQKIKVAGRPSIEAFDINAVKVGTSFHYTAKFEVFPEIALKDLAGAKIESWSGDVTDDDVANMLVQLRTQHSEWIAVDRAAKLGDRLHIDFNGEMDGKPMEGGSAKNQSLTLGSKSMIPGFEDGLVGAKKGDTKTLNIQFPKNYHVKELCEKPVCFMVIVHTVEEPKLPALDDAFAKKVGIEEGLETLKARVKEKMQKELDETAKATLKKDVLDKLSALNPIDVPTALIDAEISHLQEMTRQQFRQYNPKITEAELQKIPLARESYAEEAKKRVLLGLLLAEVIRIHALTVDQHQVQERLKEMAAQYGKVEEVLPMIQKNKSVIADVEAFVLESQAVTVLLDKASVSDVKKSYDAIMHAEKTV